MATFGPDYAMKAPPDLLMAKAHDGHPTDRADLFGKRLVVAIETEEGRRLNETLVKELTGGDRIRARRMREDFWEFEPTHTLIMATNHKPVVRGTDRGIWRRIRLIPFLVTVEGEAVDKGMPRKLRVERPGILAWCVRGALRWREQGLAEPEAVSEATGTYRREQDVLGAFLAEHTVQGPRYKVRSGVLYAAYKKWAEDNGEWVKSLTAFGMAMEERGIEKKTSGGKWYLGIDLRPKS
jgi:putative DNA primase/helicase